jgi:hypothetical protein
LKMPVSKPHQENASPPTPATGNRPKLVAPASGSADTPSRSVLQRLQHALGIDRAIAFTVLARIWSSSAGLVTVLLIARFLTRAEQGYYYTFSSLVALQIVFELGFSFVILQMASHERAHLSISPHLEISGDPVAHRRLASVFQKSVRWYSAAAILLALFLLAAGSWFFSAHHQGADAVAWRVPWYANAIAATVTFQLDPILSFLEGCGFIANVARLRFWQAGVGSLLAWSALILHHGLFAPAMMIVGTASTAIVWLFGKRRLLLGLLRFDPGRDRIHWWREVWPFQWRIAVSWLCGYFIYQLFNPVLFAYRGAVAAGQMGMSLSLANALQAVAISWLNTKAAPFGSLVARRQFSELDHRFFRALWQSIFVFFAGSIVIVAAVVFLNWKNMHFADRLLNPACIAGLLLATAVNVVVFGEALYLRAHKQEKFLLNSILGALLVSPSAYFLGRFYGAQGIVAGNLAIALLMGLPLGTYVFLKYRRLWHMEAITPGQVIAE